MESKTRKVLGSIIAVSALGMAGLKYFTNGDLDSYILPFILLWLSVIIFTNKSKKVENQKELSEKQRTVMLSIASITLIAGIVTFFITLL